VWIPCDVSIDLRIKIRDRFVFIPPHAPEIGMWQDHRRPLCRLLSHRAQDFCKLCLRCPHMPLWFEPCWQATPSNRTLKASTVHYLGKPISILRVDTFNDAGDCLCVLEDCLVLQFPDLTLKQVCTFM
jgi:hypothetical protein